MLCCGTEIWHFPGWGWHLDPKRLEPFASLVRCLRAGRPHRGERLAVGHAAPVPRGDPAVLPHLLPTSGRGLCLLPGPSVLTGGLTTGWKGQSGPLRPWRGRAAPSLQRMLGSQGVDTASVAVGPSGQLSSLNSRDLRLENTATWLHPPQFMLTLPFCLTLGNFWIKPWLPSWMLWVSFWR